eukprot:TRINITY_DN17105_c0_g1_i1.p1 TRINITY_DN17105_c0_g1~~TRINITY_DN17105_c0_g1_i1.p1  ORF type:complete len:332 (+),score=52.31 TRINITY_DN17105_c0_g1_i1:148-1143(+)
MEGKLTYTTPWPCYAVGACLTKNPRLAVGSVLESDKNQIHILQKSEDGKSLEKVAEVDDKFPATKIMWCPDHEHPCFISTTTTVNLWRCNNDGQWTPKRFQGGRANVSLQNAAPITSFDWPSPSKVGCASVDTTCTIWNLERGKIETQLIAHDKAVHDIGFSSEKDYLFASAGADGSLRLFDQRNLDHSTIMFETNNPLVKLAWNRNDLNVIATLAMDQSSILLVDMRRASQPCVELKCPACLNNISWSPAHKDTLLGAGSDGSAFIFDVSGLSNATKETSTRQIVVQSSYSSQGDELYQALWPKSEDRDQRSVVLSGTNHVEILQLPISR